LPVRWRWSPAPRGIGRATAIELARQGANIALLDIADPDAMPALRGRRLASRAELEEAARLVGAEGVRALPLVADIRDRQAMRRAAAEAARAFGGNGTLDILVANAGIAINGKLARPDPVAWEALLDVNLTGTLHSVQEALPHLRRPGGRIVVVTSVQARTGSAESGAYAVTKWGLTGLMKSLALELGPGGIAVNAVAPTGVDAAMVRRTSGEGGPPTQAGGCDSPDTRCRANCSSPARSPPPSPFSPVPTPALCQARRWM
jgi:NAD(P)-dependent dehydrogenase (short-subunit alcohol dehydrogenase family)